MTPEARNILLAAEREGGRYALGVPKDVGALAGGTRLGSRPGRSLDFRDYRDYQPGDDLRWIDWGIYARSDRLTVKLYQEEVVPHLDLLVDVSHSMAPPGSAKSDTALRLAGLLGVAALNARCSFAGWSLGERVQRWPGDTVGLSAWELPDFAANRSPGEAMLAEPPALRRNGMRVLISDLLWPGEPIPFLRRFADGARLAILLWVLSPEELAPPELGNARLVDVESGEELEVRVDERARGVYLQALAEHQAMWREAAHTCGVQLLDVTATPEGAREAVQLLMRIGVLEAG
jgi:uncharacterized protein (DUF58 family)